MCRLLVLKSPINTSVDRLKLSTISSKSKAVQGQLEYGADEENWSLSCYLFKAAPRLMCQRGGVSSSCSDSRSQSWCVWPHHGETLIGSDSAEGKVNRDTQCWCWEWKIVLCDILSALKVLQQPDGRVQVLQVVKQRQVSQHRQQIIWDYQMRLRCIVTVSVAEKSHEPLLIKF